MYIYAYVSLYIDNGLFLCNKIFKIVFTIVNNLICFILQPDLFKLQPSLSRFFNSPKYDKLLKQLFMDHKQILAKTTSLKVWLTNLVSQIFVFVKQKVFKYFDFYRVAV